MNKFRFLDPLYGRIDVSERDRRLIFAPEVQRLRYVRMCNINSLLITGASEPSRFEHVIGVLHLAKLWTLRNGISGQDAEIIHAAALLHDVQTGPFGHSLEYILEDNQVSGDFRHEDIDHGSRNSYLQLLTANMSFSGALFSTAHSLGPLWPKVAAAIRGDGPFGKLISSRIDLDNIDNVIRLAYHAGIADRSDASLCTVLANDIRIENRTVSVSSPGAEALMRWQGIRRDLYQVLLHDWAEFSAKAMLTSMLELAVAHQLLGADSWRLTDDELIATLTKGSIGEPQLIGEIGRRLTLGELYTPLALWKSPSTDLYRTLADAEFKRDIERRLSDITATRCIFHVILDRGKTEREISVLDRDRGVVSHFGRDTNEILIGLFVSKDDGPHSVRSKALSQLQEILELAGIKDLVDIEDPLRCQSQSEMPNRQLRLL